MLAVKGGLMYSRLSVVCCLSTGVCGRPLEGLLELELEVEMSKQHTSGTLSVPNINNLSNHTEYGIAHTKRLFTECSFEYRILP